MARKITVCPPISRYCLGPPAPARSPRPAATRMAAVRSGLGIWTQIRNGTGVGRVSGALAHSPYHAEYGKQSDSHHLWEKRFLLQCTCTNDRSVSRLGKKLNCPRFVLTICLDGCNDAAVLTMRPL